MIDRIYWILLGTMQDITGLKSHQTIHQQREGLLSATGKNYKYQLIRSAGNQIVCLSVCVHSPTPSVQDKMDRYGQSTVESERQKNPE